ncbi:CPBP family intramembrane metalloprotease [Agromyces endophyticus]|uniref:CPBP family intramembrane glutamic endopeptidase n=1 Tax=Agromyces sp. H17E-10 TaxID=2932244 RepID=UPI001FD1946E|nr:CPBP family intramembrane glutamic endopeptidase [Agromyces sp. H17E-10]UOQ90260.1 CPBP family intramembrane metalloprotease [Agromyces sp. H17E-10]
MSEDPSNPMDPSNPTDTTDIDDAAATVMPRAATAPASQPTAPVVPAPEARTSVPWVPVVVFAVVSCGLAWLVAWPLWVRGEGMADPMVPVIAAAMMLTPAVATLVAILVEARAGGPRRARDILRGLGMWPLRPARRTIGFSVVAIIAMPVLIAIGLAITWFAGFAVLDPVGFSGFAEAFAAQLPADTPLPPVGIVVALQFAMIPIAAVINAPFAFGEEVGWRGWLLPALRPLGDWPALLLSGAFWGFWHTPLILLGYNFGLTDVTGVLLMVLACTLFGILLGWTRLRTGSVWPAVFAHGSFNASAGMGALLVASGSPVPPAWLAGPLGLIMCIVFACMVALLAAAGQFRRSRLSARLG